MKVYFNQINLKTLSNLEDVDKNTYTICGRNGLLDLGKIIQYYLKNGNFLNLKKGNTASNQILTSICEKYLSNQFNSESGNESITEMNEEIDSNTMTPVIENTNIHFDVTGEKGLPEAIVHGSDSKKENPILDKLSQVPENASTKSEKDIEIPSYSLQINRIDSFSVKQKALFNAILRYRFSTLSVSSADAIKSYIESDIGIKGVIYILSNTHKTIKNIQDLGINTICEINDFVNSFNEIIDQVYNCSPIDKLFVEFFKKAKLFDVCIEHLKKS